ncbi:hypothetical protein TNCV_370861 [Trichonephila clavipes]|nr:hypothetical protein TNCV_370861 [Trichonephila clavipes]
MGNAYYRGVAMKSNTTPNLDTCCRTTVVMHNATVKQQHLTTVSPNSNPTTVILQIEAEFVSKHKMSFHSVVHVHRSSHHWWRQRLWPPLKGKRSNGRLADNPLFCKRRRMVRTNNESYFTGLIYCAMIRDVAVRSITVMHTICLSSWIVLQ